MKKLMLLALLLVTTIFVKAQRGGHDSALRAQICVDHLTKELNLNVDQQSQLLAIFETQLQNRKAGGKKMQDLSQEEKEAFKAERKAGKAEFDQKVASILTPEQNEAFKKLGRENNAERGPRRGADAKKDKGEKGNRGKGKGKGVGKAEHTTAGRAQKRVDRLTEQLDLEEGQQKEIYDLLVNRTPKNKRKNKKNLNEAEKAALKNNRKVEKAAFNAGIAEILTPTQLEIYNNLPKSRKGKKKGKKRGNN